MTETRQDILSEIRRLASKADGIPPGQKKFESETGIITSRWRGVYWARWGDALREAGFEPNEWGSKKDTNSLLEQFAELTLAKGELPTRSEIELMRRSDSSVPSPKHIVGHFGGKAGLAKALINLAATDERFAALSTMIAIEGENRPAIGKASAENEGWVYLIGCGRGEYKIGHSYSVYQRIATLDGHSPTELEIVWKIRTDDPAGIETYWHKRFAEKKLRKEYYRLSSLDVASFKRWKKIH